MFVPDVPPQTPQLNDPVMIAEASSLGNPDRAIGICHLIMNPPSPPTTAVNVFNPVRSASIYFDLLENKQIGVEGNITLLQGAEHGELEGSPSGAWGYFPTETSYKGLDSAVFLVEIDGYRVTVNYSFNVGSTVGGGTEGYDPYDDPKLCPNGEFWKITLDGVVTPLKRIYLSSSEI